MLVNKNIISYSTDYDKVSIDINIIFLIFVFFFYTNKIILNSMQSFFIIQLPNLTRFKSVLI